MGDVRKHRDIKFETTEGRNYLVLEPNFHTINYVKKAKSKIMLYGWRQFYCLCKKTDDIHKGIAEDVEARFDTSNRSYQKDKLKN